MRKQQTKRQILSSKASYEVLSCLSKTRYAGLSAAEYIFNEYEHFKDGSVIYKCEHCKGYHIGHPTKHDLEKGNIVNP